MKFKLGIFITIFSFAMIFAGTLFAKGANEISLQYYTNHDYHFHWNLPKHLKWKQRPGDEAHTIFRSESAYGYTAIVNIQYLGDNLDMAKVKIRWQNPEHQKFLLDNLVSYMRERFGAVVEVKSDGFCRFAGENAFRCVTLTTIEDDVKKVKYYTVKYSFIKDSYIWSVSIKCPAAVWSKDGGLSSVKKLFKGFGLNVQSYPDE